jgi:hypothetical protein
MDRQPPTKQLRFDENAPPVAGPSQHPNTIHISKITSVPNPSSSIHAKGIADGYDKTGVYVERFPGGAAGTPISTKYRSEEDLQAYLESCGPLGDRELFETAEILMTTGLTGAARTTHLQGPVVRHLNTILIDKHLHLT